MLLIWSANLGKGREKAFKEFIGRNIDVFKDNQPPGFTLLGVYGSPFSLASHDVTWVWEFDKFADLDAAKAHSDPALEKLYEEEMDHYVPGSYEAMILRDFV